MSFSCHILVKVAPNQAAVGLFRSPDFMATLTGTSKPGAITKGLPLKRPSRPRGTEIQPGSPRVRCSLCNSGGHSGGSAAHPPGRWGAETCMEPVSLPAEISKEGDALLVGAGVSPPAELPEGESGS